MLFARFSDEDKVASLRQVNSPNSWNKFQICCTDMYLIRFLPNFAVFFVFLWISRDFMDLPEFRGSATAWNIRSPGMWRYSNQNTGSGHLKTIYHFADALYNHKVHVQVACKKFIILLQERASFLGLFVFLFVWFLFLFFKGTAAHPDLTFQFFLSCPH